MTEHLRSRLFSPMMLVPDEVPTHGNLRYAAAVRALETLVYRVIASRRAALPDSINDLLGALLIACDDVGVRMTDRQVRDEVLTVMSASYDTTALALTWAWMLLSLNPASHAQLHAEVDRVLEDRPPAAADVPRLRYVEQVMIETLRLYPSAWTIGREAVRDTSLAGQPVRKDTTVLISPYVLQRDPRFFNEPDAFHPQRWADGLARRLRASPICHLAAVNGRASAATSLSWKLHWCSPP